MKIYYSKKQVIRGSTIEIKAEDKVDFEYSTSDQTFAALKNFVDQKLEAEILEAKKRYEKYREENPSPEPVF